MILNMVHQGLFGELLHAVGGYIHDLRASNSVTRTRDSGGETIPSIVMVTCIQPTASDRSPSASTSIGAISSTSWSR